MPERVAQTDAYTQLSEVDGSGPFKFVKDQWQPGHKAVYVRNPLRPQFLDARPVNCSIPSHRPTGRAIGRGVML